ncbi:MAG: hypothetical protein GTO14_16730 [Anaerolineales bacterium]|nr:hypothetical protein [Anaerolineales bacterium]
MKVGAYLLWTAAAVGAGLFVLLGYFIDQEVILGLRLILLRWAVFLAAAALFLGLLNILSVHISKVRDMETGWPYSGVLVLAFVVTLFFGLGFGPDSAVMIMVFNYVHLPVETSLMALIAISLSIAGIRIITLRRDFFSLVFVGTAILILLGTGPWLRASGGDFSLNVIRARNWIAQVAAAGGARGILLGVALGAIVTGLRVLIAVDRPYGD